ncbi:hypothetical protein T12_16988 [Trichinella patagoniensis]|uniref:Uncharacterized protein n=1 Tax=Trichinella patagoniensis TaxID=990121 RepID=A0A0V0ZTK6_9BILA|nr:hypothetical protein T12_16988 [Trichinella patagoniensis]
MPSGKRESERKGNPPVSTGPSPFSDECPNSAVEELNEPARGSGSLQRKATVGCGEKRFVRGVRLVDDRGVIYHGDCR